MPVSGVIIVTISLDINVRDGVICKLAGGISYRSGRYRFVSYVITYLTISIASVYVAISYVIEI